jgi:hypothetical protein
MFGTRPTQTDPSSIAARRTAMHDIARVELRKLVDQYGASIHEDWKRCEGLLSDFCGNAKREINVLTAAARYGLTRDMLANSSLPTTARIKPLAERLQEQGGFDRRLAYWAVESWAFALGLVGESVVSFQLRCPTCSSETKAPADWKGMAAVCPKCKSHLDITDDGSVVVINTPQHGVSLQSTVTWWVLLDKPVSQQLSGMDLKEKIQQVLNDPNLTADEKAERLEFRLSLAVLPDVATQILNQSGQYLGSCEAIVLGVLRGIGSESGIHIDPSNRAEANGLRAAVLLPATEKILGFVNAGFAPGASAIVFGSNSLCFRNGSESSRPGAGRIGYADFANREFTSRGLQELDLGLGDVLDLRGTGTSKRAMLAILNGIRHTLVAIGWRGEPRAEAGSARP